jgi:Protein of unknown function (DUF4231)
MTADIPPPRTDAEASASVSYPKLPPRAFASLDATSYIAERFNDYISWADGKAVKAKSRYQWMRAITVVGGAVVPVLVNVDFPYTKLATTVIAEWFAGHPPGHA